MSIQSSKPSSSRHLPRRQRGTSLIEVLIAVLVMAVGALGVAAMQVVSLRNSQSALERTQIAVATYSILDSMRANRTAATQGFYDTDLTCTVPTTNDSLVGSDLSRWYTELQQGINTNACASIDCNGDVCTIVVQWNDERATGGDDEQSLTTRSRI
jgi:type IV pilus assembly protein PilV